MNEQNNQDPWQTAEGVQEDLQRQPHLFRMLAENSLLVADSVRGNYCEKTAKFISALRKTARLPKPILNLHIVEHADWSKVQGEVVTFIDGGIGRVQISSQ